MTSLGSNPALVTFNVSQGSSSWPAISTAKHVALHMLGASNFDLAQKMASDNTKRFLDSDWERSEFDLPVQVVSTAPTICTFPNQASEPTTAVLLRVGNCSFKVTQAGNFIYNAREGFASFDILADKAKPQATPTAKPKPTPTPKPPSGNKPAPTPTKTGIVISGKASASGGGTGGTTITGSGSVAGDVKRTITCVKPGFKSIPVTSTNPKCPSGYKKK
jgi:hypothetical protein